MLLSVAVIRSAFRPILEGMVVVEALAEEAVMARFNLELRFNY